jgi:cell division protein FtsB
MNYDNDIEEDVESNKPTKRTKILLKIFISLAGVAILVSTILAINVSNQNKELKEKDAQYSDVLQKMSTTNGILNKQVKRADSMSVILKRIHDYMPFASTLQYRDSICSKLSHQSGDVVLMKPDSSKWVIIAVSIKGGKWQQTVNYILRDATGKTVEVEPETLY